MFVRTEHGSKNMDDLIREIRIQLLDGEYNHIALQEMTIIVNEMRDKYDGMSEDEKLIEVARIIFSEVVYPNEPEIEFIKTISGDMKVSYIVDILDMDHMMIEDFFSGLSDQVGPQVYDIINFNNEDWYRPTYDEDCTLNELLGIRVKKKEEPTKLDHHVSPEIIESILEDITGACVGINSIQRYNLFDAIAKHIDKIRIENNPA